MKKYIFLPVLTLAMLTLSGCWHRDDSSVLPPALPIVTDKSQTRDNGQQFQPFPPKEKLSTEVTPEDINQNFEYFKIRKELQTNNNYYDTYVMGYDRPDCQGFENGLVYGEDLLHMLAENDKARAVLKPQVYTKEYARRIDEKIKKYSDDHREGPASVFYLCHLSKDVDIVGAKYFFDGKETVSKFDTIRDNDKEHILFLISNDELYALKDVQILDTTGTGGEVYPCRAKLEDTAILWSCFTGLNVEEDAINGGTYRDWRISLDGRVLSKKDRIE